MALLTYTLAALLLASNVVADNVTECSSSGPWGEALEDWVTHTERHGRIMALPASPGYYVTDRVDRPPGPRPYSEWSGPYREPASSGPLHMEPAGSGPHYREPANSGPVYREPAGSGLVYREPAPPGSKIVNRPPYGSGDKFKPSPAYNGQHNQQPPQHQQQQQQQKPSRPPLADRIDTPPKRPVTDTDLYLLSAIEKLVYRADLMEKRLRKLEDSMHRLVLSREPQGEPCPSNFTRVGPGCYHWSSTALDWKMSSLQCRRLGGNLLELGGDHEMRAITAKMLTDHNIRGMDVWTGGLNPGLLWIWSHSGRPVLPAGSNGSLPGDGRCLALLHDPAASSYQYRGQDCAFRHRFICEKEEDRDRISNEIEREIKLTREQGKGALQDTRLDNGPKGDTAQEGKLAEHQKQDDKLARESQEIVQEGKLAKDQTQEGKLAQNAQEVEQESKLTREQLQHIKDIANDVAAVSARSHKAMHI